MKKDIARYKFVRAVLATFVLAGAAAADEDDDVVPGQVVVKLVEGVDIDVFIDKYKVEFLDAIESRRTYLVKVKPGDEEEFVDIIVLDPMVADAEPNFTGRDIIPDPVGQSIFVASTAGQYATQPALGKIGLEQAQQTSSGAGVTVAVIDSGLDPAHPALAGRIAAGGWNFIEGNPNVLDVGDGIDNDMDGFIDESVGHGTIVSGLIARIAPGAKILPLRVLDSDGYTTTFTMVRAVYYAIDSGAPILNISMGTTRETFVIADAMSEAQQKGVLIVAGAGNEDTSSPVRYPAASSSSVVMAVAATTNSDIKADFSNFGGHVSISAPGVKVTSSVPGGGYGAADGTSYSTPFVAGTAALVWSKVPQFNAAQVEARLRNTAKNIDLLNPNYAGMLGDGRLNAAKAVGR